MIDITDPSISKFFVQPTDHVATEEEILQHIENGTLGEFLKTKNLVVPGDIIFRHTDCKELTEWAVGPLCDNPGIDMSGWGLNNGGEPFILDPPT